MRTTALCSALAELSARGEVVRDAKGYQLKLAFPISRSIDPQGNGLIAENGKIKLLREFCDTVEVARAMFPNGVKDLVQKD